MSFILQKRYLKNEIELLKNNVNLPEHVVNRQKSRIGEKENILRLKPLSAKFD